MHILHVLIAVRIASLECVRFSGGEDIREIHTD